MLFSLRGTKATTFKLMAVVRAAGCKTLYVSDSVAAHVAMSVHRLAVKPEKKYARYATQFNEKTPWSL